MPLILQSVGWVLETMFGISMENERLGFFVGMYLSLAGAYFFKYQVQQKSFSVQTQLYLIGGFGIWLYYFIWGWMVLIPILEVLVCYVMMRTLPVQSSTRYIFCFSMFILSLCHLNMVFVHFKYEMEDNSADPTAPLMIMTQRITSLAFSLRDGVSDENLGEIQKKYAIRKLPTFPEYFAYTFNFLSVLFGPFAFYNDVMPCLTKKKPHSKVDTKQNTDPPTSVVLEKVSFGMLFLIFYWFGTKSMPYRRNVEKSFIDGNSFWYRMYYLYLSLFIARAKFYGAFLFADAFHNAAGIGYNGCADDGNPRWDLVSNFRIFELETATGLKTYLDNWNVMTAKWIRYVAYDRLPAKHRTLGSFMLSAVWHGFFPGYYIMFLSLHLFTLTQRKVRRTIRPLFQNSRFQRIFYEVVTLLMTQLAVSYSAISFLILEWTGSVQFYKSVWFVGHVFGLSLCFLVPGRKNENPNPIKRNGRTTEIHDKQAKLKRSFRDVSPYNGDIHSRHR